MTMRRTTFELRRLASIDLQAIAQTCRQMSDEDASTYLDYIVIGVHSLRTQRETKE